MAFDFSTAQRVVFGTGTIGRLEAEARTLGANPVFVTGANPGRVERLLSWRRPDAPLIAVSGEPDFEAVRAGISAALAAGCDSVIALGGGSAIDAGKAIAMLLTNGGDPLDYAEVVGGGQPVRVASAPFIAVPTTAGAGSEVTRNAVLRARGSGVKVSLRSPFMLPSVALVDPELTFALPPAVTAATGMDALSQLIEPFVSRRANEFVDALCRDGLRRVARSLYAAYRNGTDAAARTDVSLAALLGGMALANAGLGAVHGFAAPIGGQFDAPHGAVCAALLAPVMEANLERAGAETRERYDEVARLLCGTPNAHAEDGLAWVRSLARDLGIPGLSAYGIGESHVADLCSKAARASSMQGNPVALDDVSLRNVLRAAL